MKVEEQKQTPDIMCYNMKITEWRNDPING